MNMEFYRKLPIPKDVKEQFPITRELEKIREAEISEIQKIFSGESDKFLLIIGPCSADNEDAVIDYIYVLGFSDCIEYQTVTKPYAERKFISDHYPIFTTLKF